MLALTLIVVFLVVLAAGFLASSVMAYRDGLPRD